MRENNELDSATVTITSSGHMEDLNIDFSEYLHEHLSYEDLVDLGSDETNLRTSVTLWVPKGGRVDADDILYDVILEFVRTQASEHGSEITSCEVSGRVCMPSSSPRFISRPSTPTATRPEVEQVAF